VIDVTVIVVGDEVGDAVIEDVEFVDEPAVRSLLAVLVAAGMMVAREAGRVDCPDINTAHACSTTNQISLMPLLRGRYRTVQRQHRSCRS